MKRMTAVSKIDGWICLWAFLHEGDFPQVPKIFVKADTPITIEVEDGVEGVAALMTVDGDRRMPLGFAPV